MTRFTLLILLFSPSLYAYVPKNLSSGITFPTNNSALTDNPAVLGFYRTNVVDGKSTFKKAGGAFPAASFVGGFSKFGYGVGYSQAGTSANRTDTLIAGLGWKIQSIELGFNDQYNLSSSTNQVDAGFRWDGRPVRVALVFHDLTNFNSYWRAGLGFGNPDIFSGEFDVVFQQSTTKLYPAIVYRAGFVTFSVKNQIDIAPSFQFTGKFPELGIAFQIQRVVAYLIADAPYSKFTVGLKYALGY